VAGPQEEHREEPTDAVLVDRVRAGDDAAYEALWRRHVDAARQLAGRVAGPSDADDLASEAFTRTLRAIRSGGGPDAAFRPYLLSTVRRLAIDLGRRYRARVVLSGEEQDLDAPDEPSAEELAVGAADRDAVWAAWQSLPGEARDLLWRLVVHEQRPAELAPVLGTTANGVASRGKRARERLRQAYLGELLVRAPEGECRAVRRLLGGYVRDGLSARDRARVDDHLDTCERCRAAVVGLVDVNETIRSGVGPLLLPGVFGAAGVVGATGRGAAGSGTGAAGGAASGAAGAGTLAAQHGVEGRPAAAPSASDASEASGTRRVNLPLALVGGAAAVVVAGLLAVLGLLGRGTPPAPMAAGVRPPASASPPVADSATRAFPGIVLGVPGPRAGRTAAAAAVETISEAELLVGSRGAVVDASRLALATRPARQPRGTTTGPTIPTSPSTTRPGPGTPSTTPATTPATAPPPTTVVAGVTVVLTFEPSADRGYRASIVAPTGWLVTSVRDLHGGRPFEHVSSPVSTFDHTLRPGLLVVEVTPQPGAAPATLLVSFTDRNGVLLPGSGTYRLP
jgi:RNA polymerase sigma factor (sigma-70 family)